jgi:N-acetylneuraminic acid mutarotase
LILAGCGGGGSTSQSATPNIAAVTVSGAVQVPGGVVALLDSQNLASRVASLLIPCAIADVIGLASVPDGTVVELVQIEPTTGLAGPALASVTVSGGRYSFNLDNLKISYSTTLQVRLAVSSGIQMRAFVTGSVINLDPSSEAVVQLVLEGIAATAGSTLKSMSSQELGDIISGADMLVTAADVSAGATVDATVTAIKAKLVTHPGFMTALKHCAEPGHSAKPIGDIANYFPLVNGITWNYNTTENGISAGGRETYTVGAPVLRNGVQVVPLTYTPTNLTQSGPDIDYYLKDDTGLYSYGSASDPAALSILYPQLILKLPAVVGDRYVTEDKTGRFDFGEDLDGDGVTETITSAKGYTTVIGYKSLTVPAGSFRCLVLEIHTHEVVLLSQSKTTVESDVTNTWHLAPDIGIVKSNMLATFAASNGASIPASSSESVLASLPSPAVAPASSAKVITSFSLNGVSGVINNLTNNIAVTLPSGTAVNALVASFSTTGASVKVGAVDQISGVTANDFSNQVTYSVTAPDSSVATYTVTVTVSPPPPLSSSKAITVFTLNGVSGVINNQNNSIAINLPFGAAVNALVASFSTTGASVNIGAVNQLTGITANDFSNPVTYTVVAGDGSVVSYVVTVTVLPDQGAVSATGSMTTPRLYHTATLLPNGKVLVAGGFNGSWFASTELYSPVTQQWTASGNMNQARIYHTATLLPNGKVLVAGGYNGTNGYVASAELYDPATGIWTATGSMKAIRSSHIATLLPNGKVLVTGGFNGALPYLASAELYDPATGNWTFTNSMAVYRVGHTATLLLNGMVLVAGGDNSVNAELYDPASGNWTLAGHLGVSRNDFPSANLLPSGQVLLTGGFDGTAYVATAELFDPATGNWTATGSTATVRGQTTAILLQNNKILLVGGYNGTAAVASSELYDPATGSWSVGNNLTGVRNRYTATLLPNGKVLVAGGDNAAGPVATADLY